MCAMSNSGEMPEETLEGARVTLSFLEFEDSEELLFLVDSSRESLSRWLPWVEGFRSLSDAYASIDAYRIQRKMANGGAWAVRRLDDGALLGEVVLQWIDWKNRSASFGFFLGDDFVGCGYAAEAMELAIGYVWNLGLHRLEISAAVGNGKSSALAERLGFVREGVAKEAEFLHGRFFDHFRFARILPFRASVTNVNNK